MTRPRRVLEERTVTQSVTLEQIVGQKIRDLRAERGWSCLDLAHAMGQKTRGSLPWIESGHWSITLNTLQRIADAFGITAKDLLP